MRTEPSDGQVAGSPSPDEPVFEVSFWNRHERADNTPRNDGEDGYEEERWLVREAGIEQVLTWARDKAGLDRTFTISLTLYRHEAAHPPGRWLFGTNPVAGITAGGEVYRLVTPQDLDNPLLDLFELPPRLKRARFWHRCTRRIRGLLAVGRSRGADN